MARPYHHGNLRRDLIDSGLEHIRAGDSADFSLRSLSKSLGVSAAAVYHHFPDKERLLDAVIEEIARRLMDGVEASLAAAPPAERAIAMGLAYLDFAISEPALFAAFIGHDCTEGRAAQDRAMRLLEEALKDAGPGARMSARDLHLAAISAWAMVHGFAGLILNKRVTAEEAKRAFVRDALQRMQAEAAATIR